jgi:hypothetical protein
VRARWLLALIPSCTAVTSRTPTPWSEQDGKADGAGLAPHSAHQVPDLDAAGATAASVEMMVEAIPDHAFQFFAIQLDFAGGTWAHGGVQSGGEADWGGLGMYGYAYAGHEREVLDQLQNLPGRVSSVPWSTGVWYRYDVALRGLETLPAGDYSVLDEPPTHVDHDRTFWRWDFTITSVADGTVVWQQGFDTNADTFTDWSYWTETGYGATCADIVTVHWRAPSFDGVSTGTAAPTRIAKSIAQSTCGDDATSDIAGEDPAEQGTVERFGAPRDPSSRSGQAIYAMPGPIGDEYYAIGGTRSPLGFPIGDETDASCGSERERAFQSGHVLAVATAAHAVAGAIDDAWTGAGAECGALGAPTADASSANGVTSQSFAGGTISVDGSGVVTIVPSR